MDLKSEHRRIRNSWPSCAMIRNCHLTIVVIGVVVADLVTKTAAAVSLGPSGITVLPVLSLTLGFNKGVSFGLFAAESTASRIALVALAIAAIGFIGVLARRSTDRLERVGYALISGGAIGNLLDRLPDGAVTDFIDLHGAGWHFPTFNLADAAITAGVALLMLAALQGSVGESRPE